MMEFIQSKYKNKILHVFKAFIELCEKHNLQYFCHGGTAIGAVRHRGFIPWDDDIDILMPRPDYDRFLALFPSCSSSKFELIIAKEDNLFYLPFAKMCDSNTTLLEFEQIPYPIGAFIDIFPLDGVSSDKVVRGLDYIKFRQAANKLMILPKSSKDNIKWFFNRILKLQLRTAWYELNSVFNKKNKRKNILKKINTLMTSCSYETAEYVGNYGGMWGEKEFCLKTWFSSYVLKDFEGIKVRVPSGYDKLLTQIYGDYMNPPPKHKQVTHHHVAYLNLDKKLDYPEIINRLEKQYKV